MSHGRCRSCNALVLWAKTKTGKWSPFDASPVRDGVRFVITNDDEPKAIHTKTGAGHTSHFASCPNAAQHRKSEQDRLFD